MGNRPGAMAYFAVGVSPSVWVLEGSAQGSGPVLHGLRRTTHHWPLPQGMRPCLWLFKAAQERVHLLLAHPQGCMDPAPLLDCCCIESEPRGGQMAGGSSGPHFVGGTVLLE